MDTVTEHVIQDMWLLIHSKMNWCMLVKGASGINVMSTRLVAMKWVRWDITQGRHVCGETNPSFWLPNYSLCQMLIDKTQKHIFAAWWLLGTRCFSFPQMHVKRIMTQSFWISSQVKSSQKFYCNKIIKIHGIIQRLKPIGFICLIQYWPPLHCNDLIVVTTGLVWVQALRRNGRGSNATAAASCTKGYHAENLQCNQQRQRRHHYHPSAPVNKNDAKHHTVEIP